MIINIKTALPANQSVSVLAGSLFEFVTEPSNIEIGIAADATGVLATINSGPDTILEESPVVIKAINVVPVYPDDFYADQALPTDRLVVKVRDTSGVARVVMTQIRITPIV